MENRLKKEVQMDVHASDDAYYEDIIKGLYKPVQKQTMGRVITQTELDFKVEPAKEPEPAVVTPAPEPESQPEPQINPEPNAQTEPDPESIPEQELSSEPEPDAEPKILDKWKTWLNGFVKTVTE